MPSESWFSIEARPSVVLSFWNAAIIIARAKLACLVDKLSIEKAKGSNTYYIPRRPIITSCLSRLVQSEEQVRRNSRDGWYIILFYYLILSSFITYSTTLSCLYSLLYRITRTWVAMKVFIRGCNIPECTFHSGMSWAIIPSSWIFIPTPWLMVWIWLWLWFPILLVCPYIYSWEHHCPVERWWRQVEWVQSDWFWRAGFYRMTFLRNHLISRWDIESGIWLPRRQQYFSWWL